jgi:ABC transport system ATP-binding/permease protein
VPSVVHAFFDSKLTQDLENPPLPPILNAQGISKAFGAKPLFQNVSFTVSEGDRIALIGPNGSGKSTLLRILAGTEVPDDGTLAVRKRLQLSYVAH